MEECPPLHLGVLAIENEAFWLPSTTVANFTYLFNWILYMSNNLPMFPE